LRRTEELRNNPSTEEKGQTVMRLAGKIAIISGAASSPARYRAWAQPRHACSCAKAPKWWSPDVLELHRNRFGH
jgi:hypothetical protein